MYRYLYLGLAALTLAACTHEPSPSTQVSGFVTGDWYKTACHALKGEWHNASDGTCTASPFAPLGG